MNIQWAASPNFTVGRSGKKIIAIVDHITAGLMPGTLSWMRNPTAKASAHYLVTKAGEIYQLVKDEDTAWHAGEVKKPNWPLYDGSNPNRYTIGIEHEALGGESLTEAQYQATLELHRMLVKRYSIPIDSDHIIGHNRIDAVNRPNDPGPLFPWQRLLTNLTGQGSKYKPGIVTVPIILPTGKIEGPILNIDGSDRTYVPVRELAEALGYKVRWDEITRTVTIR
ncbi:MAG: N-acetylmuramoyl-L-alanine amidase [Syntrophomonadaceae bacterium]|nr:N-acetylmuramoyl-L-alanine amidase [Syntrophomonadaceae bacterium]